MKNKKIASRVVRVQNQTMFDIRAAESMRRLIVAVNDVWAHRQMNAHESPETQDAWDRLRIAVLESEHLLNKSISPRERPLPGASHPTKKPLDKRRK
ncbi:MAG: hypothetical protein KGJ13_11320 [Patescibacteria group bacterium]|nr:hypothetical protein [Patescibacteria group bacterium]